MNVFKKNIPNLITLLNLIFGLLAIFFSFEMQLKISSICILIGAILDFLDGAIARLLNVSSEIGKQLDSMADIVTFGVAPSFILFNLMLSKYNEEIINNLFELNKIAPYLLAFIVAIFSAIRLANFNIDIKQEKSFIGLPTPALAIFVASIPFINSKNTNFIFNEENLIFIALIMSILLIVKIPLFSFKIDINEKLNSKLNILRLILLISSCILLFKIQIAAIPFIITLYIILSIINNLLRI